MNVNPGNPGNQHAGNPNNAGSFADDTDKSGPAIDWNAFDINPEGDAQSFVERSTGGDMTKILARLDRVKRIDMKVAIDVVSLANCAVRDPAGNLLPMVWTRQAYNNEFENASLLTREALKRRLDEFISEGMTKNMPLLQQVNDPALLVDWVVRTTEHWERRYAQKRDEKYDISQVAMSAMLEAVMDQVLPWLELESGTRLVDMVDQALKGWRQQPGSNAVIKSILNHVQKERASDEEQEAEAFFWVHTGRHALVRLLFRSDKVPDLRERLCLVAGKLLQKKEVCNKAGGYASRQQRSDVMQEYSNVVLEFREWCSGRNVVSQLLSELSGAEWIYMVIDHTAVPVTFGHLHAPAPHVAEDVAVNCPECRHVFKVAANRTNHLGHLAQSGVHGAGGTGGAKRTRGED